MLGRLRLVDARHVLGRVIAGRRRRRRVGTGRRARARRRPRRRRPCRPRPRRPRPRPTVLGVGGQLRRQRGHRRRVVGVAGQDRCRWRRTVRAAPHRACGTGRRRRGGAKQRSPITSSGPSERLSVRVARTSQTAVQIMAMPMTTRRLASTIVVDPVEPRRGGAPDTSALIMPGSALVGRAPDRRASADHVATQLGHRRAGTRPPAPAASATACRCGCRRVAA